MVRYYKKSLGQHFLIDKNIAEKIVRLAKISKNDIVWEIGPGQGILTEKLLKKCNKLIAFEIDKKWYKFLKYKLSEPNFELINMDILDVDFSKYVDNERIKIVANLPYQITSPIIFKFIDNRELFSSITIMIQYEVADRIIARPSCKDYGRLSIKSQFYFKISKLFRVPPHLFKPKPKVVSAVIQMVPKKKLQKIDNEKLLWKIVDVTFQHRRKMLRASLKYFLSDKVLKILIEKQGLCLTKRPEELSIEEFINLSNLVEKAQYRANMNLQNKAKIF
ncbi:MAG: 16S rRNA (adenine(1518)-N(6)/adenine(1519)-N(6))-dimethyltransferase RsmA [Candidatus Cloacimonadota bacterium]|nr:16S rRNA (adenine(1518)-N(6)/adenine(1519)-N(6))-dimethyltransferase RsmA [Candidatus Cloacimonadota bacterium]